MKSTRFLENMALIFTSLLSATMAQAALYDRGGGLIYDDVLNVTWLQDANYAKTSGYDSDGFMTWSAATTWAANLVYHDSVRNVDYSDWRLPTASPINGSTFRYNSSYNGTTDTGYNISAPGTLYAGSKSNEMAYLFFNELGNKAEYDVSGNPQSGYGVTNSGPFQNLQNFVYWSGTEYVPTSSHLTLSFWTNVGFQSVYFQGNELYAMAVRPGDVAAVPEPETWAMLMAGLGLVGVVVSRRLK